MAGIPGEGGITGQWAWRSWGTSSVHPSIVAPYLPGQQAVPRDLLVLDTRKINMGKAWSLPSSVIWGKREVNPHAGCTGRDPGPPSSPWTPPAEEKSVSFLLQHPLEPLHPRSQHRPGTA